MQEIHNPRRMCGRYNHLAGPVDIIRQFAEFHAKQMSQPHIVD
jgi:hypothetical protein